MKEVPCKGPSWAKECQGSYEDEYGTRHWCTACAYGNGITTFFKHIRVPEFDAPKPGPDWIPDWIESRVTK